MRIFLLIAITIALPIAWLMADIKGKPWLRRALGLTALLWSFGIAALIGSLQVFNANSYFTSASKDLLETSVKQLRAGKTETVLREWSRANDAFYTTYENRASYRQVVDQAIEGMKKP